MLIKLIFAIIKNDDLYRDPKFNILNFHYIANPNRVTPQIKMSKHLSTYCTACRKQIRSDNYRRHFGGRKCKASKLLLNMT